MSACGWNRENVHVYVWVSECVYVCECVFVNVWESVQNEKEGK